MEVHMNEIMKTTTTDAMTVTTPGNGGNKPVQLPAEAPTPSGSVESSSTTNASSSQNAMAVTTPGNGGNKSVQQPTEAPTPSVSVDSSSTPTVPAVKNAMAVSTPGNGGNKPVQQPTEAPTPSVSVNSSSTPTVPAGQFLYFYNYQNAYAVTTPVYGLNQFVMQPTNIQTQPCLLNNSSMTTGPAGQNSLAVTAPVYGLNQFVMQPTNIQTQPCLVNNSSTTTGPASQSSIAVTTPSVANQSVQQSANIQTPPRSVNSSSTTTIPAVQNALAVTAPVYGLNQFVMQPTNIQTQPYLVNNSSMTTGLAGQNVIAVTTPIKAANQSVQQSGNIKTPPRSVNSSSTTTVPAVQNAYAVTTPVYGLNQFVMQPTNIQTQPCLVNNSSMTSGPASQNAMTVTTPGNGGNKSVQQPKEAPTPSSSVDSSSTPTVPAVKNAMAVTTPGNGGNKSVQQPTEAPTPSISVNSSSTPTVPAVKNTIAVTTPGNGGNKSVQQPTEASTPSVSVDSSSTPAVPAVKRTAAVCFSSIDEANNYIKQEEIRTSFRYVSQRSRNITLHDIDSLDGYKMRTELNCSQVGSGPYIPYDGTPFVILGNITRSCCYNSPHYSKKKKRYKGYKGKSPSKDQNEDELMTKHLCPAKVKMTTVLKFATYKSSKPTKHQKDNVCQRLRREFSSATPREFRVYVEVPHEDDHNHDSLPLPRKVPRKIDQLDKSLIEKIHDFVREGIENVEELKRHLAVFVEKELQPTVKYQILPEDEKYYPSEREIEKHINTANKLIKMENTDHFDMGVPLASLDGLDEIMQQVEIQTSGNGNEEPMDTTEIYAFTSFNDANEFIKQEEIRTQCHYVSERSRNLGKTDVDSLDGFNLRWEMPCAPGSRLCIPQDGIPFICIGCIGRECHMGMNRHRRRYLTDEQRRRKKRISKKLNCKARIRMKTILKFPTYKLEDSTNSTKYKKSVITNKLREEFSPTTPREFWIYIEMPKEDDHSHAIGEEHAASLNIDRSIIAKIHEFVAVGVKKTAEVKELLKIYVDSEVQPTMQHKILPNDRRFYPLNRDIRNHIHSALHQNKYEMLKHEIQYLVPEELIHFTVEIIAKTDTPDEPHNYLAYDRENDQIIRPMFEDPVDLMVGSSYIFTVKKYSTYKVNMKRPHSYEDLRVESVEFMHYVQHQHSVYQHLVKRSETTLQDLFGLISLNSYPTSDTLDTGSVQDVLTKCYVNQEVDCRSVGVLICDTPDINFYSTSDEDGTVLGRLRITIGVHVYDLPYTAVHKSTINTNQKSLVLVSIGRQFGGNDIEYDPKICFLFAAGIVQEPQL